MPTRRATPTILQARRGLRIELFTGDTLLIRAAPAAPISRMMAIQRLARSVRSSTACVCRTGTVVSAHDYKGDTVSTIAEEKRWIRGFR